jgi:hypothetical protein
MNQGLVEDGLSNSVGGDTRGFQSDRKIFEILNRGAVMVPVVEAIDRSMKGRQPERKK